ncbi:hypothetical protein [Aestuariivirga sp.]|uniref:hypothetical protein n=1 Tax=Aestuariivirga sp. TaxID=2650926 RepID=UPI0039E6A23D
MRPVSLGQPPLNDKAAMNRWMLAALQEIERSSHDDIPQMFSGYAVTNYTETRTLDAGSATTADIANVLCTLITDLKARGPKRTR